MTNFTLNAGWPVQLHCYCCLVHASHCWPKSALNIGNAHCALNIYIYETINMHAVVPSKTDYVLISLGKSCFVDTSALVVRFIFLFHFSHFLSSNLFKVFGGMLYT